jgi:AcrR family transcriptional regulator
MDSKQLAKHENAQRILEIGWHLFQQKGYRGVSMDELCEQCELTKPTVYYYFNNKENLFIEVLCHQLEKLHGVIDHPGTIEERLTAIAEAIFENFQGEFTHFLRDREHIRSDENRERIYKAFHINFYEPIIKLMADGVRQGDLVDHDPKMLALMYLGMINNFISQKNEFLSGYCQLSKQLTYLFINGVRKNE